MISSHHQNGPDGYWAKMNDTHWAWATRIPHESDWRIPDVQEHHLWMTPLVSKLDYLPKICIFNHPSLAKAEYRKRTLADISTWANSTLAPNVSMFYFLDAKQRHFVTGLVQESQMLEWTEPDGDMGLMNYLLVHALAREAPKYQCEWIVVPEDDVYAHTSLLTQKLSHMDSSGRPRMMGAIYGVANELFVHGDMYVMNKQALPVLQHAADECRLWEKQGYGDVALAFCLRQAYGSDRETTVSFHGFGCIVHDNSGATTVAKAKAKDKPECVDWFHKVLPGKMKELHKLVTKTQCIETTESMLARCVDKDAFVS